MAAVEGGLVIAAITQCNSQASLHVISSEHGLGSIDRCRNGSYLPPPRTNAVVQCDTTDAQYLNGSPARVYTVWNPHLTPEQLRALAAQLMQRVENLDQKVETMGKQIHHHKTVNEKLAHEIAQLKRFKFAKHSEQLSPAQVSLLDDIIDTDIAAIEAELKALQPAPVSTEARQNLNVTYRLAAAVSAHPDPPRTR